MLNNKKYQTDRIQLSNGCNVAYIDEGKGSTTLLFVHGLATYAYSWIKNIESLKEYYRCIAIDLPGNGYSDGGDYSYGMNFYAGCVYDFIQQLQLKNVVIVGHSMGGQIVQTLAINHPTAFEKLVLCAPAGFETFTMMERAMYKGGIHFFDFFSTEENSLRQVVRTSFYNYPAYADGILQELVDIMKRQPANRYRKMIEACIDGMINEPVFDKLHTIQQPTLVLFGDRDALIPNRLIHPITPTSIAQKGAAEMPGALLHILPNCGHFLQLEQPEVVNKHIHSFVQ